VSVLLAILNGFNVLLGILQQIPQTSAIAKEVQELETAVLNAISAGQKAAQASGEVVDPSLLQPIAPVA
jgi:hypothetical protein